MNYYLRKGDLFVLSWAIVRRVRWKVSVQSCLCVVEVCAVFYYLLLMPRDNIIYVCIYKYVCIWRMFVFMSFVVSVWGFVGMFVVYRPLLKIVGFNHMEEAYSIAGLMTAL